MGVVGGAFGAAAILGVSDRIELWFFGIDLSGPLGRILWTAGCFAGLAAGWAILRARRSVRDGDR